MANDDTPRGLIPIRDVNGGPYNGGGSLYHVAVGDAQVIAPGDPVIVTGTADVNGIPTVTRATAGVSNFITGVMINLTNGEGTVLRDQGITTTTLTSQYILVEDNPHVSFEIQADEDIVAADMGANASLLAGTANSLGVSGFELDSSTIGTAATLQLRILRLVRREDNELGDQAKVEVKINTHAQTRTLGV